MTKKKTYWNIYSPKLQIPLTQREFQVSKISGVRRLAFWQINTPFWNVGGDYKSGKAGNQRKT